MRIISKLHLIAWPRPPPPRRALQLEQQQHHGSELVCLAWCLVL